jgi:hypothetical protein
MDWETLGTLAHRLLKRLQTLQANENERKKPRLRLVAQPGECAAGGHRPSGGSRRKGLRRFEGGGGRGRRKNLPRRSARRRGAGALMS